MRFVAMALCAATISFASSAQAADGWDLSRDDTACGIAAQYADDGESNVMLVGNATGEYFLDVSNRNWSIAPGKEYPLVFAFDDEFMSGAATGYSDSDGRGFRIRGGENLERAFAKAKRLAILKQGEKPTVVLMVNLLGSSSGVARLRSCLVGIRREQQQAEAARRALDAKREIIPADPFFDPNEVAPIIAPSGWATGDDYPARALREEREGDAIFSLTVDPSGAVTACRITSSSGHGDLDAATCALATRRARFNSIPANAGERTYRNVIRWRIPR